MIRIAYVINYIVKNGPSNVVLGLIDNLNREKYHISLITLFPGNNSEVVEKLRQKGVEVYECTRMRRIESLLGKDDEFARIVEKGQFDVIHTNGIIPDILSSRLKCSIKRITTIHNNMYEDYLSNYGYVKSRILIVMHLHALKKLNQCICCSKSVYQVMKKKLKNVAYIRNGIESVKAYSVVTRKELGIPENAQIFLYAGVLNLEKNIVWLIENFVRFHNSNEYLLVLGNGEKEAECKEKADDHVQILGFQSDPIAYMKISDIYTSASKSEGFSISILEALSCGLGLLLSAIPSHQEVVEMGTEVYLGETFSQNNFEQKINDLRKKTMSKEKIASFQIQLLSASRMAAEYEKFY